MRHSTDCWSERCRRRHARSDEQAAPFELQVCRRFHRREKAKSVSRPGNFGPCYQQVCGSARACSHCIEASFWSVCRRGRVCSTANVCTPRLSEYPSLPLRPRTLVQDSGIHVLSIGVLKCFLGISRPSSISGNPVPDGTDRDPATARDLVKAWASGYRKSRSQDENRRRIDESRRFMTGAGTWPALGRSTKGAGRLTRLPTCGAQPALPRWSRFGERRSLVTMWQALLRCR